jgi:hypothetical protein
MNKPLNKLAFAGKIEVKFADTGTKTGDMAFSGYGSVFNNTDQARDIIAPGAFNKTLAIHKANGTLPKLFFNHDAFSLPVGVWTAMEEDEHGLKCSGQFIDTAAGRDAYTAAKAGAVTGLSIGYFVIEFSIKDGVRTILEAELLEVSVVTFPCNTAATVTDIKSAPEDITDDDFLAKLAELGVDEEDAKALMAKRAKSDDEISSDDDEGDEEDDEELNSVETDATNDKEDKYLQAAFEAVSNLIRELKQENHGRF